LQCNLLENMATVRLNYNSRDMQAVRTLDYILSMGFFKSEEAVAQRTKQMIWEDNSVKTHFASEAVLAKDWLNEKEDEAWKTL